MPLNRRDFIRLGAAAPLAAAARPAAAAEPLPLAGEADVIVAGGGPAGIAAAITAARLGKKTILFEAHGALGGIWTTGLMSCIIDFGRGGLTKEIIARLDALGARYPRRRTMSDERFIFDVEPMKLVLEEMCVEAGVQFHYHTLVVAAETTDAGRTISRVITESKSGRRAWRAQTYVDATGDGDLAARAGCGFDIGDGRGGDDQPASMLALLTVDDPDRLAARFAVNDPGAFDERGRQVHDRKRDLYAAMAALGVEPSYAMPTLFRMGRGLFELMSNHEYGVRVDDEASVTAATVRARKEIFAQCRALAERGGPEWKGLRIVATSEQIGLRGARRIHGRYTLAVDDLLAGRAFEDAVARCTFCIDVHATTRSDNRQKAAGAPKGMRAKPYDIPLRACRAKDVDNLYMAGRCISGDFLSQASYRVTGPAVEMGEGVIKAIFRH